MIHRKKSRFAAISLLTCFLSILSSCSKNETVSSPDEAGVENPYGAQPAGGDVSGEKNFAYLLNNFAKAKSDPVPWAGFWWPYTSNGIASGTYGGGNSPAGKYDAARGGRTSAQSWEIRNHGSAVPKVQGWWGHCNGWAAAAALFPEPNKPITVNGVTFGIADIKGLLTEAGMEASSDFFGNRVEYGNDYNSPKYDDVIPNQYFLILTNYVGKLKQPVLLDRFTGDQVWNQPLAGYSFEYPKPEDYIGVDPQAPNIHRILLTSTIWWGRDDVAADVQTGPFNFAESSEFEQRTLRMELWLDGPVVFGADGKIQSSGNIVVARQGEYLTGGTWKNGDGGYSSDAHPDYMWIPYSILKPSVDEDETPYGNVHIDIDWLKKHILSGGVDDPTASPLPIEPAPSPRPRPSGVPTTIPTVTPTVIPTTIPTSTPTSTPRPTITVGPV